MSSPAVKLPKGIPTWPIEKLIPYERNPRTHSPDQIEKIATSMRTFGFTQPLLVDEKYGILAGHGRLMAARKLGLSKVPVVVVTHLSAQQKRAYVIADNRIALDAGWDPALLSAELEALERAGLDLAITGFEDVELLDFLEPHSAEKEKEEAPLPAPPAKPVTRTGDHWILGEHEVLCGDALKVEDVGRVLGGKFADCVWTDPPLVVDSVGGVRPNGAGKIANDALPELDFGVFLRTAFRAMHSHMAPGAAIYIAHADTAGGLFRRSFERAGFVLSGSLIWRKDSLVLGRSDYQWQHEPILYGWKPGAAHRWYGGRAQTTIAELSSSPFVQVGEREWQISLGDQTLLVRGDNLTLEVAQNSVLNEPRPKRSLDHPTMKPVALIQRMLANSARAGDVVLDTFGGSGSTLIACENLDLQARLVELEPRFVDVIIRRWQSFTGLDARLAGEKRPQTFQKVAAARRRA